jgi:hypothetical protein
MTPEGMIQAAILRTCNAGPVRLFRNQVGMAFGADGRSVQFGLCPGSSDLIGWRSIVITPGMVGTTIAQFAAVEVKSARGKPRDDQVAFIEAVRRAGGCAGVARSVEDTQAITGGAP